MKNEYIEKLNGLIADINFEEIKAYDTDDKLLSWANAWREAAAECSIALFTEISCLGKENDIEPLTDIEQRIFLAAMTKEEKVCKEVCADGDGVDLVAVCHRIERKVKKALWS